MPQPTQNSLVHLLLMWTVILTIIQGVFIVLFFTRGQPDQASGETETANTVQPWEDSRHSPPPSQLGKMLFYKFTEVNGEVRWKTNSPENSTIIADGKELNIRTNGFYFISLRLSLGPRCTCSVLSRDVCMVRMSDGTTDLMEGWVNGNSCSTGLLATVVKLSAGSKLSFSFNMRLNEIDQAESRTHLAAIVLRVP